MEAIAASPIIDTHEHLRTIEERSFECMSLKGVLSGYFAWQVPDAINDSSLSPDGWWARVSSILNGSRNLAFYRYLLPALRDLHHLQDEELTDTNWSEVDQSIRRAYQNPDWFRHVLQERCHIETVIEDQYWKIGDVRVDWEFMRPALRVNSLLFGYNRQARDHNGNSPYDFADHIDLAVHGFDDYLELVETFVSHGIANGAVCLKGAFAYDRDLHFEPTSKEAAAAAFGRPDEDITPEAIKAFQDYIVFFLAEQAQVHSVPFQLHTGLGQIHGSRAMNLYPLIAAFPDVHFVLMHGGYPWINDLAGLAFSFPNVYLDLVWLPVISPTVARHALSEYLEVVPADRFTWGGDCWTAEEVYGALVFMRQVLLDVLIEKVESGYFGEKVALDIIRRIFHQNARKLYGL